MAQPRGAVSNRVNRTSLLLNVNGGHFGPFLSDIGVWTCIRYRNSVVNAPQTRVLHYKMHMNYTYRAACCNDGGLKTFESLERNYHTFKMQAYLHEPANPSPMCAPVSCIIRCGGWLDDKNLFQIVWWEMQNRMLELPLLVGDCLHFHTTASAGLFLCSEIL